MTNPIFLDAVRNTDFEEWRPAPGYESHYAVSSLGRVQRTGKARGCNPGRILKAVIRRDREGKYRMLRFSVGNMQKTVYTHQLVCAAFRGPKPFSDAQVRHLDGDSLNNCSDNLAWGTGSENQRDKVAHGTHRFAKSHCVNGHEFTPENTRFRKDIPNARICRACKRESQRKNAA